MSIKEFIARYRSFEEILEEGARAAREATAQQHPREPERSRMSCAAVRADPADPRAARRRIRQDADHDRVPPGLDRDGRDRRHRDELSRAAGLANARRGGRRRDLPGLPGHRGGSRSGGGTTDRARPISGRGDLRKLPRRLARNAAETKDFAARVGFMQVAAFYDLMAEAIEHRLDDDNPPNSN